MFVNYKLLCKYCLWLWLQTGLFALLCVFPLWLHLMCFLLRVQNQFLDQLPVGVESSPLTLVTVGLIGSNSFSALTENKIIK